MKRISLENFNIKDYMSDTMESIRLLERSKDLLTMALTYIPENDYKHYYRLKIGIAEIKDFLIIKD
jgi:hypothetical protein